MKVKPATNDEVENWKLRAEGCGAGMDYKYKTMVRALILRIEQEQAGHQNAAEHAWKMEAEITRLRGLLELREAKLLYYENAETCSDSLPNDAVAKFVKDVQRLQPTDAYKMVDACFREMRAIKSEIPMEAE